MAFDINLGFGPDDTWYGDYLKLKSRVENGELVEVVRCKDCKYFSGASCKVNHDDYGFWLNVSAENYCSAGERRDEE